MSISDRSLSPTPSPPLALRLFGPFDLQIDGEPITGFRSRKGQSLFALLALRSGRDVERSWLAGTLWPETTEELASASLRMSLSGLRRALGAEVRRLGTPSARTLRLDLSDATVDVIAFDDAVRRGDTESLALAVSLYRGPFLEGCLEEWVVFERESRLQHCLTALLALAEHARDRGDLPSAVYYAKQAVELNPMGEAAQRILMQTLAAEGNYAEAKMVFRNLRLRFHRDLQSEPSPETTRLIRKIEAEGRRRAQAVPVHPPARSEPPPLHLPRPLTSLIGRDSEVEEATSALSASRLVTLVGPGGVGKTRLAIRVAEEVVEEFPDGAWFVDLSSAGDRAQMIEAMVSSLEIRSVDNQPLLEALKQSLSAKSLLLILDNFEQLAGAGRVVVELLAAAPGVKALVTSREPLRVSGEREFPVPSLSLPDPGRSEPADRLAEYESVRLFIDRASAVKPGFGITAENARTIVAICRRLDGLPLAIELAAARVRLLSPEAMLPRLKSALGFLTGGPKDFPDRQKTLRATIDWSYELLNDDERSLFRRLSVFTGGCPIEAVEEVCSGDDPTIPMLDLLESLVAKSLIRQMDTGSGDPRFHVQEVLREYGSEKLRESGGEGSLQHRHATFYLNWVESEKRRLEKTDRVGWLKRMDEEYGNLRSTMDCFESDPHGALDQLRLATAMFRFWETRGYRSEGRRFIEKALARPLNLECSALRAQGLEGAAFLAYRQSDQRAALSMSEESLEIRRALGDREAIAASLRLLGMVHGALGDSLKSRLLQEESLILFRELNDRMQIAAVLNNLGVNACHDGDFERSLELQEEALAIRRELKDVRGIAIGLFNITDLLLDRGDMKKAIPLAAECLQKYQEAGDAGGVAYGIVNLGRIANSRGDPDLACDYLEQSLEILREIEDREGIALALSALGLIEARRNDYLRAHEYVEEGLSIHRALGNDRGCCVSLTDLSILSMSLGKCDRAAALQDEAMASIRDVNDPLTRSRLLFYMGLNAYSREESARALALLQECLGIARALGLRSRMGETLGLLGRITAEEDPGSGRTRIEESLRLLGEAGEEAKRAASLIYLGEAALLEGDLDRCDRSFREGLAIFVRIGTNLAIGNCFTQFAALALTRERFDRAARLLSLSDRVASGTGAACTPRARSDHERMVSILRRSLDDATFAILQAEGSRMTLEQGVAYATDGWRPPGESEFVS